MRRRQLVLIGLASALVASMLAFFTLGYDSLLSLQSIRDHHAELVAWYRERPLAAAAAYFAVYVLLTAVSLPGAAVLTLAGGAIFGLGAGLVLASFASTAGATLAFLASRHLLRDLVARRFAARLGAIDAGLAREGAFYLFTLRLVPLVPFFVINLVMGLTRMKARTFYLVSQLGMLPATLLYVNAGTELARVESLRGVVSPAVLGSLALLGIFPLLAQRLVTALRRRHIYRHWKRPRRFDRNLVVIGGGAAGLVTSYIAAAARAKVTLVEAERLGGDCLYRGCVPSKTLIGIARLRQQMTRAGELGLEAPPPQVDFARAMARVADVVRAIEPHDSAERYRDLGVDVRQGQARIVDPWTVEITVAGGGVTRLTTRAIVLATGSAPVLPPLPGLDAIGCLTTDTVWSLRELPARLLVLGGGPSGCELAQCFARLGAKVALVESAARLLGREDEDVSTLVRAALEREGVDVLTGHEALRCEPETGADKGASSCLVASDGAVEKRIGFDRLLCAVGRAPRLRGFGLEALGLLDATASPPGLTTDAGLHTLYPHIYAAGDVAGPRQFTHVAAHQAWYAAVNALLGGLWTFKAKYACIPWVTFVDPEIARVGLNEREAAAAGVACEVTRFELRELDRAMIEGATEGFVKVLTAPGKDRILGATIVGAHAGELIPEFVLAMKHGLGVGKILASVHAYPTRAEANKYAAGVWRRAHAPDRMLRWIERYHDCRRG